jgi:hypothetical protein
MHFFYVCRNFVTSVYSSLNSRDGKRDVTYLCFSVAEDITREVFRRLFGDSDTGALSAGSLPVFLLNTVGIVPLPCYLAVL